MNGNSKLALYRLDQSFPPVHVSSLPALGELEDLLGALVVAPRPAGTWQQSGNPLLLEGLFGHVVCLAADPESFGHVADRASLDLVAAQHLVFDLHAVARVEELVRAGEGFVAHALRIGMERARRAQRCSLGILWSSSRHQCQ